MPACYIMCRSLTYAQRAARAIERAGITATVAKAPQGVVTEGCTYCVRVSPKRMNEALEIIRQAEITPGKIFIISDDGAIREVRR